MTSKNTTDSDFLGKGFAKARKWSRGYAGFQLRANALTAKFGAAVFEKFGFLIPKVGTAKGQALALLCDKTGDGLTALADRFRAGDELNRPEKAALYLTGKVNQCRAWLTPAHLGEAYEGLKETAAAVKAVWPDARIPALVPVPAGR